MPQNQTKQATKANLIKPELMGSDPERNAFLLKEFITKVNAEEASPPPNFWCVPGLVCYRRQFVILDRCSGFVSDQDDPCFEFISHWSSQSIVDHFDTYREARARFERDYEYSPRIERPKAKPASFESIRTVEVRDLCFEGGDQ